MGGTEPSLALRMSDVISKARLQVRRGLEGDLQGLSLRFTSGIRISPTVLEVEIDDLITNLRGLSEWPYPDDVTWDDQLAALATDSVRDAEVVEAELDGRASGEMLSADAVWKVLGDSWVGELTSFQRRDIAKLLSLRHGANFSVPGAGKTRVGLAVYHAARRRGELNRLLIVGPKSCYESWREENAVCLRSPLRMQVLGETIDPSAEALIVNYERLPQSLHMLGRWLASGASMLLLDEAHRMKLGATGAYGAACLALGPRAQRRVILTGTPAPNGIRDLENLFSFVWPGSGRQRVIRAVADGDLAAASRTLRPLFTRTTKAELGLPPTSMFIRPIPLPPLHREIYDALVGQFSARAQEHVGDFNALGRVVMYLLMAATTPALLNIGGSKYDALSFRVPPLRVPERTPLYELMEDLPNYELAPKYREVLAIVQANADAGRKTLVWSTFVRNLTTLQRLLARFSPAIVHGGTQDREKQLRRFRSDRDCMVLLTNPSTLGEGISLHHECHDAVYVDRDFAAGRFMQSVDRIHRLGLRADTITRISVLASEGTIDEVVALRLQQKINFMGGILDDPAVRELADLYDEPAIGEGLDDLDVQALMRHVSGHTA
ncbi:MAG: DEAD/DEAH box helicase [Jatrophihabitans sp.]|uniref:DEAD/DEAH box helicase n=1 Tax=Jatrophihabitans sp. TaxID=1932789 RepID=UPI003F820A0D